ncbi:hypothetical protein AYI70_g2568, partial [Smittium culicis]
MFGAKRWPPEI